MEAQSHHPISLGRFCIGAGTFLFALAAYAADYRTPGSQKAAVCQGSTGGGCGPSTGSGGGSAAGALGGAIGNALGQAIGEALFGNSADDGKRQAEAQRQAEIQRNKAAQRSAELEAQRVEEERRADQSRARLLGSIKRSDSAPQLQFKFGDEIATKPSDPAPKLQFKLGGESASVTTSALKPDVTDRPVALLRSEPGPDAIRWTPVPLAGSEQRDVNFASAAAEGRIRLGSLENVRQLALYDYLLLPGSGSPQAALESNRWLGNFGPDEGIAAYLNGYTPGSASLFGQIAAIHDAKGAKWDDYAGRFAGEQGPFDPRGWREAVIDAAPVQIRYLGSRVVYEVEHAFLIDGRN